MADFLAGRSTTSSRRGKIVGGPELRGRGQRVDVVKDFEMVVLNRCLGPHSASLDSV